MFSWKTLFPILSEVSPPVQTPSISNDGLVRMVLEIGSGLGD